MLADRPEFLLIAEAETSRATPQWRFVLHGAGADETIAVCDEEPDAGPERLALIAVVRGLEALDQPSDVTVVTRNASIARGLQRGLDEWRNNHWRWECFGRQTPVRNADLWRRIDRVRAIHRVRCRSWRFEADTRRNAASAEPKTTEQPLEHFTRIDAPTVLILPAARRRRRVRIAPPSVAAAG